MNIEKILRVVNDIIAPTSPKLFDDSDHATIDRLREFHSRRLLSKRSKEILKGIDEYFKYTE